VTCRYITEDLAFDLAAQNVRAVDGWWDTHGGYGPNDDPSTWDAPLSVRDALAYTDDLDAPTDDRGADQTAGVHHYEREGDR
jgi:hypothetical protein